jgi:hypothetical protein
MDGDFRRWEVFVNTGPSGFSAPPHLVFRCLSDRTVPSRIAPFQGEPAEALTLVEGGDAAGLVELLESGTPLS